MNKSKFTLLTAAFGLAIALTLSCTDDKDGGEPSLPSSSSGADIPTPVTKARIGGVSQKGPFVVGSTATLRELDGEFSQTGRAFSDIIADDHGKFDIRIGVELVSPYAMLEADGYYRNEVTGKVSTAPIKLYAIADIREKDNINVNLLTHLEYYRVLHLVENEGKTVAAAKKQAQKEILAVFGIDSDGFINSEDMSIFGASESDAALLAVSILLQSDLSEGPFSQRLTNFAQSLRVSGTWSNEAEKRAMADWASRDGVFCYENDNECWRRAADETCKQSGYVGNVPQYNQMFSPDFFTSETDQVPSCIAAATFSATTIKSNILKWNLSSEVPDFEKYINVFWNINYNLGVCNSQSQWSIKKSPVTPYVYVCKDSEWQWATSKDMVKVMNRDCSAANEGSVKEIGVCLTENSVYKMPYTCKNGFWVQWDIWGDNLFTLEADYGEYGCDFGL